MSNRVHRQSCAVFVFAIVVAMLLLPGTRPALAQGTSGTLPDPITSAELSEYADRLGLSSEQRRALGGFYEQYHQQFRQLRDGEIADFLNSMQSMEAGGMGIPEREIIERFQRDWQRVLGRIRTLDDSFFNSIRVLLTDQQMRNLPHVQMARERHRYQHGHGMMFGGGAIDLSAVLLEMELSGEEREQIDRMLFDYETRLTRAMRESNKATSTFMTDIMDALEELGFGPDSFEQVEENPEAMQEMMEASQQAMQRIWERMFEKQEAIRDLNLRTYQNISPLLNESTRRTLRNRFVEGNYPTISFLIHQAPDAQFVHALELEDLDADLRRSLEAARAEFAQKHERLLDDAIRFAREHSGEGRSFMFGRGDDWEEYQEKLNDLRTRHLELGQEAQSRFRDLVPRDLRPRVRERQQAAFQRQVEQRQQLTASAGVLVEEEVTVSGGARRTDPYVPGPIGRPAITAYAEMLDLDESGRAILDELFESYLAHYDEQIKPHVDEIVQASGLLWQHEPETNQMRHAGQEAVTELYRLRRDAKLRVADLEEQLFEQMRRALTDDPADPRMTRIIRSRVRERVVETIRQSGWGASQHGAMVDLSRLARRHGPLRRHLLTIEAILDEWEEAIQPLLADIYTSTLALREADEVMMAEMHQASMDNWDMAEWQEYHTGRQERLGTHQRALRELMRSMREQTLASRDAAMHLLPDDAASSLLDAFNRRAYPEVFSDATALHDHLQRAFELPDLTDRQRDQLAEIAMEYRSSYRQMSDQMIELRNQQGAVMAHLMQPEDWREHMQFESQRQRLVFDRSELNARMIRELEAILSEAQIERLGGLPQPQRPPRHFGW